MTGPIEESSRPAGAVTATAWPDEIAEVLTGAAEQARAAVAEFSGAEAVGDYLGVSYEDPNAATHRFLAHLPGYQGWQWAVVVASYLGADHATISEVVLIPGPTALLAPEWVPWEQRVRPGDLGPGDLLAPVKDDPRLVPGYTASGDPQVDDVAYELGLGRRWVMSAWGRADAAERWHEGDYGPDSAMSRSTKRVCRDCGFFLPLAGSLGAMFGVCGNELSADGHVVDKLYGCGAHSDTPAPPGTGSPMYEPYDDGVLEVVQTTVVAEVAAEETVAAPVAEDPVTGEPVPGDAVAAEPVPDEPVAAEPVVQPATEDATREPSAEGPAVEEPSAD
ncbi:hypothetical protein MKCMC460_52420 [Mycobacterium sp. 20KCMC460]|uniref:DUF3027 domain-containing protein n=1 Tax=Mycobacterium kiyosense TaxID=2871094 RepID=A0A9P3Q627_9MYCO|nr:hypothetical protein IWGMT90018_53400 [Mycobacterium kiyosense]BDE16382.1 hypothetical protein MKCMC460_52420 [Mycobacterium sp. 20KCMC460]GLB94902.1 hypothetical protein SRL2020226_16780 [Mycobacterium kiyosense]GLC00437.1 hypothetical protein SRL2020400_10280 [Mycobacterium kiyosense]GLD17864.1 hypothetical protein Mkiyose1385_19630 [Mycobacterium kiyosense]